MMKPVAKKHIGAVLTIVVCVCSLVALSAGTTLAASNSSGTGNIVPGAGQALAYAGYLKTPVGSNVASIGPLFPAALGRCDTRTMQVKVPADSLSLGTFAGSGTLVDKASNSQSGKATVVQASSDIQNVNVLSGLITANEVKAAVTSRITLFKATSTNNSKFTNLVVAGKQISGTPAPNTTINLVGLGVVILNEQVGPVDQADYTSIAVTAIDVKVTTQNSFGLPIGTHILIAHAESQYTHTKMPAVISAKAYGLFAFGKVGSGFTKSGPWA